MADPSAASPFRVVPDEAINPLAFFESALTMFHRAEKLVGGSVERHFRFAGVTVNLHIAGGGMFPSVIKAIQHLASVPAGDPSLTVYLWDDASTGIRMPPPPWVDYVVQHESGVNQSVYTRRGDVRGYSDNRVATAYNWGADALSLLDRERGLALYWTRDASRLPSYESSAPIRTILHWWLNRHGGQLVHAAAVGRADAGVLLAGKGGSGKSTAALTCLRSDLLYAADDYCLVTAAPEPHVHSLYSSAKVDVDNLHRVPHLMPALDNAERLDREKAVFFLAPHFPGKIASGFPVRAILLPRVTGRAETRLTPATSMDAVRALALSTMSQLAGAHRSSVRFINELAHQVPCRHLELGTDLARIPAAIAEFLDRGEYAG